MFYTDLNCSVERDRISVESLYSLFFANSEELPRMKSLGFHCKVSKNERDRIDAVVAILLLYK